MPREQKLNLSIRLSVQSHTWLLVLISHILMNMFKFLWVVQSASAVRNNSSVTHELDHSSKLWKLCVTVKDRLIGQRVEVVPSNAGEVLNII